MDWRSKVYNLHAPSELKLERDRNRDRKMRSITLEEYVDFVRSGQQRDITIGCLNQIVSMHGFRKLSGRKALKETLIDAVKTIDLIEPSRSTLKDSVSSAAFLEPKDVIADLGALNWHECTTTSVKTLCKEDPLSRKDDTQSPPRALEWNPKRSGKGKQNCHDGKLPEVSESWTPADPESDPERVLNLTREIKLSMKNMETSNFYEALVKQIEDPEVFGFFRRVLGSHSEMQMVVYGIGSIRSHESPRLQLSLALLMKRKFSWIGGVEVFDPVLSGRECKVLESFTCRVLSMNEQCRRTALKPTLFFMPHCAGVLYDNLLQANWRAESLKRIALFGNSFKMYKQLSRSKYPDIRSAKHVLAAAEFADEIKVESEIDSDDIFRAFHNSSWHFFGSMLDPELPCVCS